MTQNQGWGQQPPSQPGWQQPPPNQPGYGQPPPKQQGNWPPPPNQGSGTTKICPRCGSHIDANAMNCPVCGASQPGVTYGESKSRPLAIFLALLLGTFGIHRFYVGPVAWGILYLVFFWTWIPGFLAWLEALYWLTRSDVEWAQKYGGGVRKSNGLAIGCLWIFALLPLLVLLFALLAIPSLILLGGEISEVLSEIAVEIEAS